MKFWYFAIGTYMVLHIGVMTKYSKLPAEQSEAALWLFALQWVVPMFMLVLLIPKVQRALNRAADLRVWTVIGSVIVVGCVALYFTSILERWFAWSTLGLLTLLVLLVARHNTKLGNVSAWLLGAMVVLLAIGSWEVIYQTGLLAYYDFFGSGTMSYYVTIAQQLMWVIPALIVILVLYQRGLRPHVSRIALSCIGVSVVCTTVWFVNGMDIPLLFWQGYFICVNKAARPWAISVSRGSQSFWLVGITSLFVGGR